MLTCILEILSLGEVSMRVFSGVSTVKEDIQSQRSDDRKEGRRVKEVSMEVLGLTFDCSTWTLQEENRVGIGDREQC